MEVKVYTPELISRRGEFTAWALSILALSTTIFLQKQNGEIPIGVVVLLGFLILSSISVSIGNWVDRNSQIRISMDAVSFRNGLRNVNFMWQEIEEIKVLESNWGSKVVVLGKAQHFNFRTMGKVYFQGEMKGKLGFSEGDKILKKLLDETALTLDTQELKSKTYKRN